MEHERALKILLRVAEEKVKGEVLFTTLDGVQVDPCALRSAILREILPLIAKDGRDSPIPSRLNNELLDELLAARADLDRFREQYP